MLHFSENPWWSEEYDFFGSFYMEGDNSKEGYLIEKKQSLSQRTEEEVRGIVKLLNLNKGDKVLDCPCGYGRHSIQLATQGFSVTGSDLNSTHLQEATLNTKSTSVVFKRENMLTLPYKNEFSAVINMFYSFGFFATDEENRQVLQNFFNALMPGGKFLMHTDVNIPRILSGRYKNTEKRNLQNGKVLKINDSYNPDTRRINGAWTIVTNGSELRKDYSVRVYTKEEFEQMCLDVGFSSVTAYSNWNGDIYTKEAEDMIIVATK